MIASVNNDLLDFPQNIKLPSVGEENFQYVQSSVSRFIDQNVFFPIAVNIVDHMSFPHSVYNFRVFKNNFIINYETT